MGYTINEDGTVTRDNAPKKHMIQELLILRGTAIMVEIVEAVALFG